MNTYDILLAAFILIVVVSIDIFMVGFSYGTVRTKIKLHRLIIISLIGNIILGAALIFGYFIVRHISEDAIKWTVFSLFMLVGIIKICTWTQSQILKKIERAEDKGNPEEVKPKIQSWKETIILAIILAIDGIGIGFATGLDRITWPFILAIIGVSFFTDIILFRFGQYLGIKLAKKTKFNLGWLNGTIFIALAIINLFI